MAAKQLVTRQDCELILRRKLTTQGKVILQSFDLSPFFENPEGYLSAYYKLKITYIDRANVESVQFFVKHVSDSISAYQKRVIKELRVFEREGFFYNSLAREFDKRGFDTSFCPKNFLCKGKVIVLDDLTTDGYKAIDGKIHELETCKIVIKNVAKMHAAGILYQHQKSSTSGEKYQLGEAYAEIFKDRYYPTEPKSIMYQYNNSSIQAVLALIDLLPEVSMPKDKIHEVLLREFNKCFDTIRSLDDLVNTCVHGDLWSNNVLLKRGIDGVVVDCKLVDYQGLRYNPPAFDLLKFLYLTTTQRFRKDHLNHLLQFYYDSLSEYLSVKDLSASSIFSYEDFLSTCHAVRFLSKLQAVFTLLMVYIPEEMKFDENGGFRNLVEKLGTVGVEAYKQYEEFRSFIEDDLLHLTDMLQNEVL